MSDTQTIEVQLLFHDHVALKAAGLKVPEAAKLTVAPALVPTMGDAMRVQGTDYPSGEVALFRVSSRTFLVDGNGIRKVQLGLTLLVAHEP